MHLTCAVDLTSSCDATAINLVQSCSPVASPKADCCTVRDERQYLSQGMELVLRQRKV